MERNYRSTPQIVEKAQSFISQNKGRYEKNMTAERGDGEAVILEQVESREAQFMRLLEIAKTTNKETAFLYRDNESAVVLVDLFLRNNIPFKLRKPEMNFFGTRMVKTVVERLSLVKNEKDTDSFSQLSKIRSSRQFDNGKTEILSLLAKQEPNIQKFLSRLTELEKKMQQGFDSEDPNAIVLSTIHSSKGLEYDTVYMVDVYDGRFPSSRPNIFSRSKDNADGEQEERRLFYVGITRAKNHLTLFYLKDQRSGFIDELFPEEKKIRLEEENRLRLAQEVEQRRKNAEIQEKRRLENMRRLEEERRVQRKQFLKEERQRQIEQEQIRKEREKAREEERIHQQQNAERNYNKGYNEVKDKFTQQHTQIRDSFGTRWIKCEMCGEIKPASEFGDYSGPNRVNLGKCYKCTNGK
jgi:superfamily I DNA/RNA helicase